MNSVKARIFYFVIYLFLLLSLFFIGNNIELYDLVIGAGSLLLSLYGLNKLIKNLDCINVFLFTYYFGLYLSRYKLSVIQLSFGFVELIYILIFPLLLIPGYKFFHSFNIKPGKLFKINIKIIQIIILILYIMVCMYIIKTNGILLFMSNIIVERFNNRIPFASMFLQFLEYVLLSLSFYRGKVDKISIISYMSIFLFSGILIYSRGNIMRYLIFILLFLLVIKKINFKYNLKHICVVFMLALCIFYSFSYLGEYRYSREFNISSFSQTNIGNKYLDWMYTYIAINYDIASVNLRHKNPLNYPYSILYPALHSIGMNYVIDYSEDKSNPIYVSGYTSATFLREFIVDYGYYCFIEIIILGCVLGYLSKYSLVYGLMGFQTLLLSNSFLSFFSNNFMNISFIYSCIFCVLVVRVVKN